jgi:hypothetical protein
MDITGAGGGLLLALAAGLWLAYLVPNWLRRKEFYATERNAVRLSQTIRVLAETSEAPQAQLRSVKAPTELREARAHGPAAREVAPISAARRVRRSRAIASLVMLGGVLTAVAQLLVGAATGWSMGGVVVLGTGAVLVVSSVTLLRRLASVPSGASQVRSQPARTMLPDIELPSAPVVREWTPVPIPQPRVRPQVVPSTMADPRVAAAAAAEQERRARLGTDRQVAPMPAPLAPEPAHAPAARESRFASMGVVDGAAPAALPDLDAVLARRRA